MMSQSMQQQQHRLRLMGAVLGPDPGFFEALISVLMSPVKVHRVKAEIIFNTCRNYRPDAFLLKLARHIRSPAPPATRAMSAVLLRRLLSRSQDPSTPSPYLWPRLSSFAQSSLQSLLISALHHEDDHKSISRKLCDVVAQLASNLLPDNAWPELLPFLFRAVTSGPPHLQESCLLILAQIMQHVGDSLLPTLHSALLSCLSSPVLEVRIAALSASVNFVHCVVIPSDHLQFQNLLVPMFRTFTQALNSWQESTAQDALKLLIELAGSDPGFFRRQLADVIRSMLQVVEADGVEEGTKHLAMELLVTLAETRPGMMRELPLLIEQLLVVLMNMLVDIKDDAFWHCPILEHKNAGESSSYSVGQECLDRISIALGGNTILPIASERLIACLSANEWEKRHAALITLAQIAEGCAKVMTKNPEQVVTMALNSFRDIHPRVRWAAINAIEKLSTYLGPDLQLKYHQRVLPALVSAMDDYLNYRVQAHATSAVLKFSKNCTPDILSPYLDDMVTKLLALVQNGKYLAQEGALTALASVAESSQEYFQKYYYTVMPFLKAILVNATGRSNRMLRAKSMECISLVGLAVGKEMFKNDAGQVIEVLMTLQGSHMEVDDPILNFVPQTWDKLCKCLGQDFLPCMTVVMPRLLSSAQLKPDVALTFATSNGEIIESDVEGIGTIRLSDERNVVKTSVLEEKATACNMLCCYADEMKEGFFPWTALVTSILVPLLKFYFHEEVRKAAVSGMPKLLRAAKLAVEKGVSQPYEFNNDSHVKKLTDFIIPSLVKALHKEPETEISISMLGSLNECLEISGHLLDESQVRYVMGELKNVVTECNRRKMERSERTKAEEFDAEEEIVREENIQEEEVFDGVGNCLRTLINIFKASFIPFFDEISMYISPMLGNDKTAKERRVAICIFDDVAEQCREAALKYYDTHIPFLLEACTDENPDVRKAAVYGVGICAEFGGFVFKPFVGEALSKLNDLIMHPNALDAENIMAYDSAVSALGKICQFQRDNVDESKVIPAWLNCLPIKNDLFEAKLVHDQLCLMVERADSEIFCYLPRIITVFSEIICGSKDLVTEQTARRIVNLLRHFHQTLPPSVLASALSTLQPQQQQALQSLLSR